jgi:hypothetical protein
MLTGYAGSRGTAGQLMMALLGDFQNCAFGLLKHRLVILLEQQVADETEDRRVVWEDGPGHRFAA